MRLKRTQICMLDDNGAVVWRGWRDTQPEMIAARLADQADDYDGVWSATGSWSPRLFRALKARRLSPVVAMDARRAAQA